MGTYRMQHTSETLTFESKSYWSPMKSATTTSSYSKQKIMRPWDTAVSHAEIVNEAAEETLVTLCCLPISDITAKTRLSSAAGYSVAGWGVRLWGWLTVETDGILVGTARAFVAPIAARAGRVEKERSPAADVTSNRPNIFPFCFFASHCTNAVANDDDTDE